MTVLIYLSEIILSMGNPSYQVDEDDGSVNVEVVVTGRTAVDIAGRCALSRLVEGYMNLMTSKETKTSNGINLNSY